MDLQHYILMDPLIMNLHLSLPVFYLPDEDLIHHHAVLSIVVKSHRDRSYNFCCRKCNASVLRPDKLQNAVDLLGSRLYIIAHSRRKPLIIYKLSVAVNKLINIKQLFIVLTCLCFWGKL